MPPVNPVELLACLLLGLSVVLVPTALAVALFSLARSDRPAPSPAARHTPRRAAAAPVRRPGRFGRQGRRFPGR